MTIYFVLSKDGYYTEIENNISITHVYIINYNIFHFILYNIVPVLLISI